MRVAIYLAITASLLALIFAAQMLSANGVNYDAIVLVLFIPLAVAPYLYGSRLADRDHYENSAKFDKFTGTSNGPIFGALFRASKAGDRLATWSLVVMFSAPFLFGLLIFTPKILGRFFG